MRPDWAQTGQHSHLVLTKPEATSSLPAGKKNKKEHGVSQLQQTGAASLYNHVHCVTKQSRFPEKYNHDLVLLSHTEIGPDPMLQYTDGSVISRQTGPN